MTSPSPSEAARALDRLIGTTVDGKYKILDLLGRGGMGAVFRPLHLGTDRTVALKVIVPDYAGRSDFLARFEREARACGRLRHPNIVDVTDFGYDDSGDRRIAYLVMEYLDGCSLADVLRDEATLPVAWVVDVLQQAGSAGEEAHRRRVERPGGEGNQIDALAACDGFDRSEQRAFDRAVTDWELRRNFEKI